MSSARQRLPPQEEKLICLYCNQRVGKRTNFGDVICSECFKAKEAIVKRGKPPAGVY